MIENIDISGNNNYKISDSFRKYATKRIGKLDRYMPRGSKKDIIGKIVVTEINRAHGNKYSITVNLEIPGGKVLTAKDECSNTCAGIDILEAKLKGQIHRYKLETNPHLSRKGLKNLFIKRS